MLGRPFVQRFQWYSFVGRQKVLYEFVDILLDRGYTAAGVAALS